MLSAVSLESRVSPTSNLPPTHKLPLPAWARATLSILAAVFLFAGGMAEIGGPRLPAGHYAALGGASGGFVAGDEVPLNQLRPHADANFTGTVRRSLVRGILSGDGSPAQPATVPASTILPASPEGIGHADAGIMATPRGVIALAAQPRAPPSGPRSIRTAA